MTKPRSSAQLAAHYTIERELADRLRSAPREARSKLYAAVYDELFARVPDHPLRIKQNNAIETNKRVNAHLPLLRKYTHCDTNFLEVGAGDGALSLAIAPLVRSVVAVDVCRLLPDNAEIPPNFRLHISADTDLGVDNGSISLAYSNQLLEHLHPDDTIEHLRNVVAALVDGGVYVCVTPNRLTGPHDISRSFDDSATGLHLREYSGTELRRLFLDAGFSHFEWYVGLRGHFRHVPFFYLLNAEALVANLPTIFGRQLGRRLPLRKLLGGIALGTR